MTDGINTIQGVRTYEDNSGQWTTPDALAGSTDDPSSQKAYLWNGGNPFTNSDPSGNYDQKATECPAMPALGVDGGRNPWDSPTAGGGNRGGDLCAGPTQDDLDLESNDHSG